MPHDPSRYQRHHEGEPIKPNNKEASRDTDRSETPSHQDPAATRGRGNHRGGRRGGGRDRYLREKDARKFAGELFGTYLTHSGFKGARPQFQNPPRQVSRAEARRQREEEEPKEVPAVRSRSRSPVKERPHTPRRSDRVVRRTSPPTPRHRSTTKSAPVIDKAARILALQQELAALVEASKSVDPDGDSIITGTEPVIPTNSKRYTVKSAACLVIRQRSNPTNKYNIDPNLLQFANTILESQGTNSSAKRTAFKAATKSFSTRKLTVQNIIQIQTFLRLRQQEAATSADLPSSPLSSVPDSLSSIEHTPEAAVTPPFNNPNSDTTSEAEATPRPFPSEVEATLPIPSTPVRRVSLTVPATPLRPRSRSPTDLPTHRSLPTPFQVSPSSSPFLFEESEATIRPSYTDQSFSFGPLNNNELDRPDSDTDGEFDPDTTAFIPKPLGSDSEESQPSTPRPYREQGWIPVRESSIDDITLAEPRGDPQELLLPTDQLNLSDTQASPPDVINLRRSPGTTGAADTRIHLSIDRFLTARPKTTVPQTLGLSPALSRFSVHFNKPLTSKMAPTDDITPDMAALFEKFLMQKGLAAVTTAATTKEADTTKTMDYVTKEALKPEVLGVFDPAFRPDPKDAWLYKGPPVVSDSLTWDSRLDRLYDLTDAATAGALQETYNRGAAMDWWLYQVAETDKVEMRKGADRGKLYREALRLRFGVSAAEAQNRLSTCIYGLKEVQNGDSVQEFFNNRYRLVKMTGVSDETKILALIWNGIQPPLRNGFGAPGAHEDAGAFIERLKQLEDTWRMTAQQVPLVDEGQGSRWHPTSGNPTDNWSQPSHRGIEAYQSEYYPSSPSQQYHGHNYDSNDIHDSYFYDFGLPYL
ncbi:hypothetical protein BJ508DRAFT_336818 [Ascobolus immersus RN42]|uniref:Uncharacterized protein n=1 Tax=Ascobolus immersus RN42 TaxID=1160509 RepID=A0A3N4HE99_ASCIM|nr:hypothetical protein BJ508DRAFT_336818 [Ascobolus immersus RN42]